MDKLLNVNDITNRPIEEVIELYQRGYRLNTLQACATGCVSEHVTMGLVLIFTIAGIFTGLMVANAVHDHLDEKIRKELKQKCPGCLDKIELL